MSCYSKVKGLQFVSVALLYIQLLCRAVHSTAILHSSGAKIDKINQYFRVIKRIVDFGLVHIINNGLEKDAFSAIHLRFFMGQ